MTRARLLRLLPAAGASTVLGLVVATRPLEPLARAIAVGCVVGAWAAPLAFRRADVRAHASVVAAIAAVTAAGQVDGGAMYGVACALFLVGCLASMRAARAPAPRGDGGEADAAPRRAQAILLIAATLVAGGLMVGLPRLAARIERHIDAMFAGEGDEATAFSTSMVLGSTRGMLQSDAIVMRIDGAHPAYLRGAVYDRYDGHNWTVSTTRRDRTTVLASAPTDSTTTRITLVRSAPNGADMRWFLPAGACDLAVSPARLEIDAFGVARRVRGEDPPTIAFHMGRCSSPPASVAAPSAMDLDVRDDVRGALAPIAARWTEAAHTNRQKLEAIQRELGRFEYSLAVSREREIDPIVDFVTVHRSGHCEMFASAMVLMARTQGIPARVIGGYHVTEVNHLSGLAVVRDRNAHAWVEAWVDGAWRGLDPTPVGESFAPQGSVLDNIGDLAASWIDRLAAASARLGALGTVGLLLGIIALLLALRSLGFRIRARVARKDAGAAASSLPLPCFTSLTGALTDAGHVRDTSEPLETFARRIAQLNTPWALDASRALSGYAGLRYGGIGQETSIARAVEDAAQAVRNDVVKSEHERSRHAKRAGELPPNR